MQTLQVSLEEVDNDEESGFFFKRLGEIAFSHPSDTAPPAGAAVAVASRNGVIIFSDSQATYVARSTDLLGNLQKWDTSDEAMPLKDAAAIAVAVLPGAASSIALSPDASLLALGRGTDVAVYAMAELLSSGAAAKRLRAASLGESAISAVKWRPSSSGQATQCAALTQSGAVMVFDVKDGRSTPLDAVPPGAACIAWSPDGTQLAVGVADRVALCSPDANGAPALSFKLRSCDVDEDDNQALAAEGVHWVGARKVLVVCRMTEGGGPTDLAPVGLLFWEADGADSATLAEFFAISSVESSALHKESLVAATVPQWGTTVYAHTCAFDDHIKAATAGDGVETKGVGVTDDRLAVRIPLATGDMDNAVVGLGMDLTATGLAVEHPTDETAPDLPPQPLLWVATSDGVLRAYTFGTTKEEAPVAVAAAEPVPAVSFSFAMEEEEGVVKEGGGRDGGAEAQAAATALPSDESDFEEEEVEDVVEGVAETSEETGAVKPLRAAATAAAEAPAGAAIVFGAPSMQPAAAATVTGPEFGFAAAPTTAPAFGTPATAPPPLFGAPMPPPPAARPLFGTPSKPAPAPAPAFDSAAASVLAAPTLPSTAASTAPAPAPAHVFSRMAPEPPLPTVPVQWQQAQALTAEAAAKPLAAPTKPPAAPLAAATPPPPPKPARTTTAVSAPTAHLQGAGDEVAGLEREFLKSLAETRSLEAATHDALSDALRGAAGVPASQAEFEELRKRMHALCGRLAAASDTLAELRHKFGELVPGVKESYTRIEAMPAFQSDAAPAAAAAAAAGTASPLPLKEEEKLRRQQPLDPTLGALRDAAKAHLRALGRKLEEVRECLAGLEERARSGSGYFPDDPAAQTMSLYEAVNAQTVIIQAQASRLFELCEGARRAGLSSAPTGVLLLEFDGHWQDEDGVPRLGLPSRTMLLDLQDSSPLLHVDSSSKKKGRIQWQPLRASPVMRRLSGITPSPPHTHRSLPSPSPVQSPSPGPQATGPNAPLVRDILRRCKGVDGGVRVVEAGTARAAAASQTPPKTQLPPLKPMVLPELPKPVMPSPPPARSAAAAAWPPSRSLEPLTRVTAPAVSFTTAATAPARPKAAAAATGPPQPPLPSFGQMKAASALERPRAAASSYSQPPLPSMAQVASAKDLANRATAAAGVAPRPAAAKPPSSSSSAAAMPPVPSAAAAQAAQARLAAFTSTEKKTEAAAEPAKPATSSTFSFALSPASQPAAAPPAAPSSPFGRAAPSAAASSAASTSSAAAAFGSFGFGANAPAAAPTTAAAASPFGKGLSFGTPAASAPAATTGSLFGAAPASAAAAPTSPFGGPAASTAAASPFGASAASSNAAVSSPFGVQTAAAAASSPFGAAASPFGAPAAFGAKPATTFATTTTFGAFGTPAAIGGGGFGAADSPAPGSPFGASAATSTGFGQSSRFGQSSGFGAAAPSGGGGGGGGGGFGQSAAFGQAATAGGGGFGAFASQSSGFSTFAAPQQLQQGGGFGGFGGTAPTPPPKPSGGTPSMWQPRK